MESKKILILGAGPAGLTAAYELLTRTNHVPIVIERLNQVGGISRTEVYNGKRIDLGGHRFFSKSDRVVNWWLSFLKIDSANQSEQKETETIAFWGKAKEIKINTQAGNSVSSDARMLIRPRKSRILHKGNFFDYPLTLNLKTIYSLGVIETILVGLSYLKSMIMPIKPETNLEEFIINRFGKRLFKKFFKSYTEKVWGMDCKAISSAWGAQRIKGLSIKKVLMHAFGIAGSKKQETSLIEKFLYPYKGPGQLWEVVADKIMELGGEIYFNAIPEKIVLNNKKVELVQIRKGTEVFDIKPEVLISTIAIDELAGLMPSSSLSLEVENLAKNLKYRNLIVVGLLISTFGKKSDGKVSDNWLYIQDERVDVGRIQIFNNWSPGLVPEQQKDFCWIGMEYFCDNNTPIYSYTEQQIIDFAFKELLVLGLTGDKQPKEATVIKVPKAYPSYFGESYHSFEKIKDGLNTIVNLRCIGRNGMHRYNNQDHSMLTAMVMVDLLADSDNSTSQIWDVNTEDEYHEEK